MECLLPLRAQAPALMSRPPFPSPFALCSPHSSPAAIALARAERLFCPRALSPRARRVPRARSVACLRASTPR
eukprot:3648244-Pleurochrysis_carterae.AAC.1